MHRLLYGILLAVVVAVFIMIQPVSEWIVGGWDPGIYMNNGVYLAQHGASSESMPSFSFMMENNCTVFSRVISGRCEAYPGIPIDQKTGSFKFYFYPVTPLWIAFLYRVGGISATFLAMSILGMFAVLFLFYGMRRYGWSPIKAACASLLLFIQPIFLYHMHTPCSEMMELMLMTTLLVWFSGFSSLVLFPIIILACLNRPEFIISAAVLAMLVSTGRWPEMNFKSSLRTVISVFAAIGGALIFYNTIGASSLVKINRIFMFLQWGVAVCLIVSCLIISIRFWKIPLFDILLRKYAVIAGLFLPCIIFVIAVNINPRSMEIFDVARHLIGYAGWPILVLTIVGIIMWTVRVVRSRKVAPLDVVLFLYLFNMALPFGYKHVADLYPWATKRFLPMLPLLISLFSTNVLWETMKIKRYGQALALVFLLLSLGWNIKNKVNAWSNIEYQGVYNKLSILAEKITGDDIVVSDHFLWATPLTFCFDRQVLNGVQLWDKPSFGKITEAYKFLYSMHKNGHRILLLTSTDDGINIFPDFLHCSQSIMDPMDYSYNLIAHHGNSKGFNTSRKHSQFLLSEWIPKDKNND